MIDGWTDDILCFGELRGNEQREGDTQHHDVRRHVEDSVSDQVVDSSRTLDCGASSAYIHTCITIQK